jgi:hypothetical protein
MSSILAAWLTNSALLYEPKYDRMGGYEVSAIEYSCAHGAQINFGDLTPYLTYGPGQKVPHTAGSGSTTLGVTQ